MEGKSSSSDPSDQFETRGRAGAARERAAAGRRVLRKGAANDVHDSDERREWRARAMAVACSRGA